MCHAVGCRTCGKVTWAGCGAHVDQVRALVPEEQWCAGHPRESLRRLWHPRRTWQSQ
ncbi:hypothetical protein LAUMK191_04977 [Mycobacterium attenuatum]|uniref:Uncharacterized protein n=1 Tax=Mycobacterium attenuatum TaxID=2341086 RepID=A0A498QEJ5_9MYCO|nr:hypothetical protein LAUMK136_04992 [Mycobacterium attenuatum]VBA59369.1 hypothetical protein LAUMK191_04977 [Mycobacterium attenuatum]VBA61763.1 hypothetical protein LAUMK41_05145 [Mycobacterium attenuatum]